MGLMLLIFKYFGLLLAAVSSVWGTIHNLTMDLLGGKKRLTRAGMVAILFTVLGLVVSIVSEDLQRRQAAKEQMNQITAEAKRTNRIIVSAQPLTSLAVSLRFESSDEELRKSMAAGERAIQENAESSQGGVPRVPFEIMEYQARVVPLLQFLANLGYPKHVKSQGVGQLKRSNGHSIVAVIPLDDSRNSVLSVGQVEQKTDSDVSNEAIKLPAGIAAMDREAIQGRTSPHVNFSSGNDNSAVYDLVWDLDPVTLKNAITQGVDGIHPTANLPRSLKIPVLRGKNLPFERKNFALSTAVNLWADEKDPKRIQKTVSAMELVLKVNGFNEMLFKYKLDQIYPMPLYDDFDDDLEVQCTVFKFVLVE